MTLKHIYRTFRCTLQNIGAIAPIFSRARAGIYKYILGTVEGKRQTRPQHRERVVHPHYLCCATSVYKFTNKGTSIHNTNKDVALGND